MRFPDGHLVQIPLGAVMRRGKTHPTLKLFSHFSYLKHIPLSKPKWPEVALFFWVRAISASISAIFCRIDILQNSTLLKSKVISNVFLLKITSYKNTVMLIFEFSARIFGESTSVGFFVESTFIMN